MPILRQPPSSTPVKKQLSLFIVILINHDRFFDCNPGSATTSTRKERKNEIEIERYSLIDSTYGPPEIFNWNETLPMITFPDFTINLWDIFEKDPEEKPEVKSSPATTQL